MAIALSTEIAGAPAVCRNARRESSIVIEFPPEADAPEDIPNQEYKAIFEPNQTNVKQRMRAAAAKAVFEHCVQ